MHAAVNAAHHVFTMRGARARAASALFLEALHERIHDEYDNDNEQKLGQSSTARLKVGASLPERIRCVERRREDRGIHRVARYGKVIANGRGERIRTSDSCVPNAVL